MSETIVKGDTPTFEFTIKDDAGAAVDLSSATSIKFIAKSSTSILDANAIFDKTCTVVAPATNGVCKVTLLAADTAVVGIYKAEVELRFTDASIITASQFILEIVDDIRTVA